MAIRARSFLLLAWTSLAALTLANGAAAAPTLTLSWRATTGAGTPGTSTIYALPGDYVALDIEVHVDTVGLSGAFARLEYDSGALLGFAWEETPLGSSQVCPEPPNPFVNVCRVDARLFTPLGGTDSLQATNAGPDSTFGHFDAVRSSGPYPTSGVLTLGRAIFQVVSDGEVVVASDPLFNSASDSIGNVYLLTASANVVIVPEPGTAVLLALGVVGLGVMRHHRRR